MLDHPGRPVTTLDRVREILAERLRGSPIELDADATGVEGVIVLTPGDGRDEPVVRWQAKPGKVRPHVLLSIGDQPDVVARDGVTPELAGRVWRALAAWIKANKAALLAFHKDGRKWPTRQVDKWTTNLKPLPTRKGKRP